MTDDDLRALLRGSEGSRVDLRFRRAGAGARLDKGRSGQHPRREAPAMFAAPGFSPRSAEPAGDDCAC